MTLRTPTLAETRRKLRLLDELADLSLRVDEAQAELELGVATNDVWLAAGAARRVQSLGFLMGEEVRKYERTNR